jgi:hypothetical protein
MWQINIKFPELHTEEKRNNPNNPVISSYQKKYIFAPLKKSINLKKERGIFYDRCIR